MIFEFGVYKLDVDVERTRCFYENPELKDNLCDCAGCRNFRMAYPLLPDAVQVFFRQLGVGIGNPAEMTAYGSRDGYMTLYDGFYHVCGSILEGPEQFSQTDGQRSQLDDIASIKLTPDHFVYFTHMCGLVKKDFPAPIIQLEIEGNVPWVLEEPNPYHYSDS